MKTFAFILSFYVLVLTAIPCIDVPVDNTMQKSELKQGIPTNQQNDIDLCSPFCTCYCCSSPICNQVYTIQISCFPFIQGNYSYFSTTQVLSPIYSIWQPPKLS